MHIKESLKIWPDETLTSYRTWLCRVVDGKHEILCTINWHSLFDGSELAEIAPVLPVWRWFFRCGDVTSGGRRPFRWGVLTLSSVFAERRECQSIRRFMVSIYAMTQDLMAADAAALPCCLAGGFVAAVRAAIACWYAADLADAACDPPSLLSCYYYNKSSLLSCC